MILIKLNLENFKRYKELSLDFSEGLSGIIGKNGAGKSTIFDAISFALYADVRGAKETIRYAKADPKDVVKIELTFEIEHKEYRVLRELRGKNLTAKAYLYSADNELIAQSAKEVTKEITKLIGMSKDAFNHTVFASQKELTSLSSLKNEDRKKIIRKLLGLEKIDKIESEIVYKLRDLNRDIKSYEAILLPKEEVDILNKNLKEKENILKNINDNLELISKELKEAKAKETQQEELLKSLQKQKDDYVALNNNLNLINSALKALNNNKEQKQKMLQSLMQKEQMYKTNKHILNDYTSLEKEQQNLQKQKELQLKKDGLLKEQVVLRKQYEESKKEITALKKKIEQKELLLKSKEQLNNNLKQLELSIEQLQKNELSLRKEIANYEGQINDIKRKVANIEKIGKDSNCPTCTRPLLEEYDNVIESLKSTITTLYSSEIKNREESLKTTLTKKEELQLQINSTQKELQKANEHLSLINSHEEALKSKEISFKAITNTGLKNKKSLEELKDITYDKEQHIKVIEQLNTLKPKYEELLGLSKLIAQIPAIQKELSDIEKEIDAKTKEHKEQTKAIKEHTYNQEKHTIELNRYQELRKNLESVNLNLSNKGIEKQKTVGEIDVIKNTLKRDSEQKRGLALKIKDRDDYDKLKLLMAEFKNRINSQVAPRISQLASTMYAEITKGKYQHIEVNNEFDFFIYDDGIRYPIERFSGGEIDLANLVLRIAISKTLSELSGSGGVGFLAFDEVFGSQDQERRFEIMQAFHTIKEQYRQIFLISHESEIKEMFERVIEL